MCGVTARRSSEVEEEMLSRAYRALVSRDASGVSGCLRRQVQSDGGTAPGVRQWLPQSMQDHFTLAEHQSKVGRNTLIGTLTAPHALHEAGPIGPIRSDARRPDCRFRSGAVA